MPCPDGALTIFALLLAALRLAVQDTGVSISILTIDGNLINGEARTSHVTLMADGAEVLVELKDVVEIKVVMGEATVRRRGSVTRGTIVTETLDLKSSLGELSLKLENIAQIKVSDGSKPTQPSLGPIPQRGITPNRSITLDASEVRALRSPDGKKIYLLNASDAQVLAIDLAEFTIESSVKLAGRETFMSLAPSGEVLVAGGGQSITAVSLPKAEVRKTFRIETPIMELCAIANDTIIVLTTGSLVTVSISKQAIVDRTYLHSNGGRLLLSPDRTRLYTPGSVVILPDVSKGTPETVLDVPYEEAGALALSPDGRFGVGCGGAVFRMGKSYAAAMLLVAVVEHHSAAAWAPAINRAYFMTSEGFVKEYDARTWDLARSWELGYVLIDAYVNDAGTLLQGVGKALPEEQPATPHRSHRKAPPPPPWEVLEFTVPLD